MRMRVLHRLNAFPLLRQIPAADRLVITNAKQILPAWMEHQASDPVVVPRQRLDQRAARVPQLDALVAGARGEELAGAAGRGGFPLAGEGGEKRVGGCGREGAAFDDVLVAKERGFDVAGGGVPQAGGLVGAGGEEPAPVEAGRDVADPVRVAAQRLHAVAGRDVPDAEGLVAGGGDEEVAGGGGAGGAGGDEAHGGDGVVVAGEGARVFVFVGGVPELDGEVGGARGEEGAAAGAAVVDVEDGFGVAFDGAFELAELPVPDLDGCVFGAGGEGGENGVEGDAVDGAAVRLEGMPGRAAGKPGGRIDIAAGEGCWRCGVELCLEGCVAGF